MLFTKFVQIGRVIQITKGKDASKLAVIINIIDCNRLLVDGPQLHRQEVKVKDARLLKFMIGHVNPLTSVRALKAKWEAKLIELRFSKMPYSIRQEKLKRRSQITDFEYFQMRCAQRKRSNIIHNAMNKVLNKEPRAIKKLNDHFHDELNVKLGYKKRPVLTEEEKKQKAEKKTQKYLMAKAAKTAKARVVREKRVAKLAHKKEVRSKRAAAGLSVNKTAKKTSGKKYQKSSHNKINKRVNLGKVRRQLRDSALQNASTKRKQTHAKNLTTNSEKKAAAAKSS